MKRLILLIVCIVLLTGCGPEDKISSRDFVLKYPDWEVMIDGKQINKYHFIRGQDPIDLGHFLSLETDEGKGEIYLSFYDSKPIKIGNTGWAVWNNHGWGSQVYFISMKKKEESKIVPKSKRKEDKHMTLSLGTWVLLILAMVIVAKLAHKISLKTIFRPTKRSAKHVKKEWEEA